MLDASQFERFSFAKLAFTRKPDGLAWLRRAQAVFFPNALFS
jgi:hypothetical protein